MPYYSNYQGYPIPRDGEEGPPDGFNGPMDYIGDTENWGDILQTLVREIEQDTIKSGTLEDRPAAPDITDGEEVVYLTNGEGGDEGPTLYIYTAVDGWRGVAGEAVDSDQNWTGRRVVIASNQGYPGDRTGGDIAQLFRDFPNDTIILPEGDYNLDSTFHPSSGGAHEELTVIGDPHARIHVNVEDGIQFAELASSGATWFKKLRLQNLTLVQNNSGDGTDTYDASWGRWWVADLIDNRNLRIEGQRDYHGVNSRYGTGSRAKFSYHANITTQTGVGIHHNIQIPDGDDPHTDISTTGFDHATGVSSEPGHVGTNYWLGCHVAQHWDNGYYLKTSDIGRNIIVGCTAKNCGAGMFRIGRNDVMMGNFTRFDLDQSTGDYPTSGVHIDADQAEGTAVIGHRAENETATSDVIRLRSNSRGVTVRDVHVENNTSQHSARVTYEKDDTSSQFATATDRAATITLENCYFNDHGDSSVRSSAVQLERPNARLVNCTVRTDSASYRSPVRVEEGSAVITGCNLVNAGGGNTYVVELGKANTSSSNPGATVDNVTISDCTMDGGIIIRDPNTSYPNTFHSLAWYACDLRNVATADIFYYETEDRHTFIDSFAFFANLGHLDNTEYGTLSSGTLRGANIQQGGNAVLDASDESGLSVNNSQLWQGYEIYVQSTAPTTSNPYIRFEDS